VATLRRLRATATFFEIGADAERLPAYSRREGRVGAVGDHTQTHATLTREPLADVVWEIAAGRRSVARATGRPVELFRPPGGHRDRRVDSAVARQHLLSVLWTVDPRDWARRTSAAVVKAVESDPRVRGGAIILLHENHATTIAAVARVVKWLRARGLRLVTVPRLLADDPPTLVQQRRDLAAGGCTRRAAVRGAMNAAVSRSR
jgi:peptidoglycan-N-acetylglucosamine deacetylase